MLSKVRIDAFRGTCRVNNTEQRGRKRGNLHGIMKSRGIYRTCRAALPPSRIGPGLMLGLALLVCLLASGCGGTTRKLSEHSQQTAQAAPTGLGQASATGRPSSVATITRTRAHPQASKPAPTQRCVSATVALGSSSVAYAALVVQDTDVRSSPGASALVASLGPLDINHLPTVVGVIGAKVSRACTPEWYRVELSVIPNGTMGWVPARAVRLYRVASRIVVNLATRTLRLYRRGKLVMRTPVGIGAPGTPTPVGRFFVDERYVLTSADGPFGPAALGISAHSDTLQDSWVEQGPIALHGTNEPWSIGEAASHGCVHIPNAVMRRLFALAPDGTPVVIQD